MWDRWIRTAEIYRRLVPGAVRRDVLPPLGRGLGRVRGIAWSPLGSVARLMGVWGSRPAAETFWIWPGFREGDRQSLYTKAFHARLDGFDPALYLREAYSRTDGVADLDRVLQVAVEMYLPDDLLVKTDIALMANSLEARWRLLDYRVPDFAASLPGNLHVKGLRTKHLLKRYAASLAPRSVIYRRKQGFSVPMASWLRGPLHRPLERACSVIRASPGGATSIRGP